MQANLLRARRNCERAGNNIVSSNAYVSFGVPLVADDCEKRLDTA